MCSQFNLELFSVLTNYRSSKLMEMEAKMKMPMKEVVSKRLGIKSYIEIIRRVEEAKTLNSKSDIENYLKAEVKDEFCRYFKMRSPYVSPEWINAYFSVFAELLFQIKSCQTSERDEFLTLALVLNKLDNIDPQYKKRGENEIGVQCSFATKMIACICPHKPIWDCQVCESTGINLRSNSKFTESKIKFANDQYLQLIQHINQQEIDNELRGFFEYLLNEEDFKLLTKEKMIDFYYWMNR